MADGDSGGADSFDDRTDLRAALLTAALAACGPGCLSITSVVLRARLAGDGASSFSSSSARLADADLVASDSGAFFEGDAVA